MTPAFLDHVVIETTDMEASLAFYVDVLGLHPERVEAYRQGLVSFVSVRAGRSLIDLFPTADHPQGPPHFCLTYDLPMSAIQAQLHRCQIDASDPQTRYGADGDGLSIYVRDPDGHTIELRTYHPS
jgi:catechol 2,3-dioxygenase-like lactoylglutathione lyase family enzyme